MMVCTSLCMTQAAQGAWLTEAPTPTQTVQDFSEVAKDAIPAVVFIKVNGKSKSEATKTPDSLNRKFDMFGDDFLKKFFGLPDGLDLGESPITIQGSGFIVSADGKIVTNAHVVKEPGEITVILNDGTELPGKVLGMDTNTDIAVLQVEGHNLPFVTLADSDKLKVGQWAIAVGTPFGLQATLTVGVISATGRSNLDITQIEDFIQTDAAINRGNSGGPLLDIHGKVIGMNTAIATTSASGYLGIGFAIPSNMIQHVVNEIEMHGKVTRGFLGVIMQPIDANLAKSFSLEKNEGALVAEVSKDSPAENAGIQQGDVILKYNNLPVSNIGSLKRAVALMSPGTNVKLTVLREGKQVEIPVTVGTFPTDKETTATVESGENKFGFTVESLTPEIAQSLGYKDEKGVVIGTVKPGSPAAYAGLKKGALILAVNHTRVSTVADFNKELEATPSGKPTLFLVKQGTIVRFVSLLSN